MKLKKVLIANRGEIALRVLRTLRVLGLKSVAVYSDADRDALHVRLADEAVRLGPAPASESYLRGDLILQAALKCGAQGIHPGYGFLSERHDFAQAVEDAGLVFIGPTPASILKLGDKLASRNALRSAGIPPVPGSSGSVNPVKLKELAEEIGFPLLLKAAAGGGGKGIRIVRSAEELGSAFDLAASEAKSSFGSSALIAERYLERARHIELQVLGDGAGGVQLFFERDCSTQRRLQKVVEETPSPSVTTEIREKLLLRAGRALSSERYRGAGTLEFLLASDGELYFLEMNTRLQVEHPVTEMTAGIDLVAEQVAIAEGKKLPAWKDELSTVREPHGAAIEFRLNAEDPEEGFSPVTGKVTRLRFPGGPGVRVDSALEAGTTITPFYDPLLAKIIAWGPKREGALLELERALRETHVGGLVTNLPLGIAILTDPLFLAGKNHCQYLEERIKDRKFFPGELREDEAQSIAAAAAFFYHQSSRGKIRSAGGSPSKGLDELSPWVRVKRLRLSPHSWEGRGTAAWEGDGP